MGIHGDVSRLAGTGLPQKDAGAKAGDVAPPWQRLRGAVKTGAMSTGTRPWPTEIRLSKDRRTLTVFFDTGESFALPAELLRVTSPSAEVQGHSPSERKTVPGKRDVGILEVNPVGNYAVRLVFDDMHSTGLYGWDYLHETGRDQAGRMQAYLDELAAKGLSREPVRR
jgi:DUF971 family protein